ncbi:MAG: hypothetical protein LIP04_15910 [Tannerellaceae bacterium]|nr:hypothetical protein [Tannerellaceae bacterium]
MKNGSTQCMKKSDKKEKNQVEHRSTPRKRTLDFLTQFAWVYHTEPTVNNELCGFVMN